MSLVVTGTIGIDTIQAPTGSAESVLGGSCTYFAAAASFHGQVRLVAAVGEDFPESHRTALGAFPGIDLAGLETRRGSKTFRWGGKYLDNMNHRESLFTHLGVLAETPPPVPSGFEDSQLVFLANMHPGTQRTMMERFPRRLVTVCDTMDLWINLEKSALTDLIRRVDGLVLNYDEAELFTGERNPVTAARRILAFGPTFVVVKKGEHGALLIHRDGLGALPAYPSETVVDPTGAGDTFAGGMMGYLASLSSTAGGGTAVRKETLLDFSTILTSLAHATVMASFTIESFSLDRLKRLSGRELAARLAEFRGMLRFS